MSGRNQSGNNSPPGAVRWHDHRPGAPRSSARPSMLGLRDPSRFPQPPFAAYPHQNRPLVHRHVSSALPLSCVNIPPPLVRHMTQYRPAPRTSTAVPPMWSQPPPRPPSRGARQRWTPAGADPTMGPPDRVGLQQNWLPSCPWEAGVGRGDASPPQNGGRQQFPRGSHDTTEPSGYRADRDRSRSSLEGSRERRRHREWSEDRSLGDGNSRSRRDDDRGRSAHRSGQVLADDRNWDVPRCSVGRAVRSDRDVPRGSVGRAVRSDRDVPRGSVDRAVRSDQDVQRGSVDRAVRSDRDVQRGSIDRPVRSDRDVQRGSVDRAVRSDRDVPRGSVDRAVRSDRDVPRGSVDVAVRSDRDVPRGSVDRAVRSDRDVPRGSVDVAVRSDRDVPRGSVDRAVRSDQDVPRGSVDRAVRSDRDVQRGSVDRAVRSDRDVQRGSIDRPVRSDRDVQRGSVDRAVRSDRDVQRGYVDRAVRSDREPHRRRDDSAAGDRRPEKRLDRRSQTEPRASRAHNISETATRERDQRAEETERLELEKQRMIEQALMEEKKIWTRSSPADLFYQRSTDGSVTQATDRARQLCTDFSVQLVKTSLKARAEMTASLPASTSSAPFHLHCCHSEDSCSSESDNSGDEEAEVIQAEMERKAKHPGRIHPELWFNEAGKMNVSDVCRCSLKARKSGIRHNIYAGEEPLPLCDPWSNNADKLFHYRVLTCPPTNLLVNSPTSIEYDGHEFLFEGFSLLSHHRLDELPPCHIIRFNIEYTVLYIPEKLPASFVMREVQLFEEYLVRHLLELYDFDLYPYTDTEKTGCPVFHMMPRFARDLPDNGKELLAMTEVLAYLMRSYQPLVSQDQLKLIPDMDNFQWRDFADRVRGMLVCDHSRVPSCLRLDQLDRDAELPEGEQRPADGSPLYPDVVHFGVRPSLAACVGNQEYQKAWRAYLKQRRVVASLSKPTADDKRRLTAKQEQAERIRSEGTTRRDVTVAVSSRGFYRTGVWADVVQHALFLPVVICNLRFHKSLDELEKTIKYKFINRHLLQLALTHPSYRLNHGTNPDHSRNSMSNCGIRQPEYGDRCIHYTASRKRGLDILINIMSQFGKKEATESRITHNERLEFFGDAVVEFLTSIHLFFLFPGIEEGGLATYRAAIVQNQNLAVLAGKLGLQNFLLYAHGADLCHDSELRHAMANCFESLMGALYLDGGIELADRVFSSTLYMEDELLLDIWQRYPPHPLQEQEPNGDRKWIEKFPRLQELQKFEERIGVEFMHIRILARVFTDRSVGYNNLTLGSNQRLEFLGDSVLQLIASEYLYTHFPEHHEGHLSLLRSSLVNNRTQSVVCTDLGMTEFATFSKMKTEIKLKDKADLLEALIGAIYVDKGLDYCRKFCEVCFFPRLQLFIMNQDWNDPKSKLQQCCLTLRKMDGTEPDIPIYKVIECKGPTNSRVYTVAVYFQGNRLSKSSGHSIQTAEMNAATQALADCKHLFPQLDRHQRVIAQKSRQQRRQLQQYYGTDGASSTSAAAVSRSNSNSKHQRQSASLQ